MRGPERIDLWENAETRSHGLNVLGEDNVDRHDVRIEAIDTRTIDEIVAQIAEVGVPCAPEVIGDEPPKEIEGVRTGDFRDAVPGGQRKIHIRDGLAIDVNFERRCEPRNPFDDETLGSVPLIEGRRYNR